MPDDRDVKLRRSQTQTERDLEGLAKKRERDSAVHDVIPNPFEREPITGNYEGEELQRMRREKRTTGERVDRLEMKHDQLVQDVTETRVLVGEMRGELKVLPELVSVVKSVAQAGAQREHVTFTAKVDVDKAREEAKIRIDEAEKKDVLAARAEKRVRVTKWIGAIVGVPAAWELLKYVIGLLR